MKKVWQGIALGTLGAAAIQCFNVAEQVLHGVWITMSMGYGLPVLTAGTGMLRIFVVLTVISALGGLVAYRRLRIVSPSFARCAKVATVVLMVDGAVWLGLIASPLVELVQR